MGQTTSSLTNSKTSLDRYKGSLLGLAVGDALGTSVEFMSRGSFPEVTDMIGGGMFDLYPGEWTDDTSMALCLADSLVTTGKFDTRDQMERYIRWMDEGYLSSNGECFDIGHTVRSALLHFQRYGNPYSGSTDPRAAGNGSIMRLAPVPMFFAGDLEEVWHYSGESSRTTHGTSEAVDACRVFGVMIAKALGGDGKEEILFGKLPVSADANKLSHSIQQIAMGDYREKSEDEIMGTGYVVESLEAALWCFYHTDSYEAAVLRAVNLGDDADTTGAVVGQIAGAYYGINAIPKEWLDILAKREHIEQTAESLFSLQQL